jgi:hypothetical protein
VREVGELTIGSAPHDPAQPLVVVRAEQRHRVDAVGIFTHEHAVPGGRLRQLGAVIGGVVEIGRDRFVIDPARLSALV